MPDASRPMPLPTGVWLAAMLLAPGAAVLAFAADATTALLALITGLEAAAWVAGVFLLGGTLGWALVGRWLPRDTPPGLRLATAVAMGLWALATILLAVGTWVPGSLHWPWWIALPLAGALAAPLAAWRTIRQYRWPPALPLSSLAWVGVALAAGAWMAGATIHPGYASLGGDAYDVLSYHLQLPREWATAGQIGPTPHNAYGYYPLGMHMLFLAAQGGRADYDGIYAAQFVHMGFGLLGGLGLYAGLGRARWVRPVAAGVLATVPIGLYLGWLAFVELGQVALLAIALGWLARWARRPDWRLAAAIGLLLGASCAVKYLSLGFVVAPVLAAMLAMAGWSGFRSLRRRTPAEGDAAGLAGRRAAQTLLAALLVLVPWSPWLVRNAAYTGNPLFPLATETLGRGHWSPESQQRWEAGHDARPQPPVPPPPHWTAPDHPGRAQLAVRNFLLSRWYNPALVALAACGLLFGLIDPRRRRWTAMLAVVLAVQVAFWTLRTRGMPARFLSPAIAPLAILAVGALAAIAGEGARQWRALLAGTLAGGLIASNLVLGAWLWTDATGPAPPTGVWPGHLSIPRLLAADEPAGGEEWDDARFLLIGQAAAFYFPPGTLYATAFDDHPLARWVREGMSPEEILQALRQRGVTHLYVDWAEIHRLAHSYGYPRELWEGMYPNGLTRRLDVLDALQPLGLEEIPPDPRSPHMGIYALPDRGELQ